MNHSNNNNESLVPAIKYDNTDTDKSLILLENKGKTGIYLWTHKESGKIYVGSAVDLSKRLRCYYSISYISNERRSKSNINSAILKYGYNNFSLSILEYIDINNLSKAKLNKLLLEREQHYLDLIFSEAKPNTYNILRIAGNPSGNKHSEESIIKISEAMKGKFKGEKNPMFGKSHSEETKALMSEARSGENHPMFGKTHSDEARIKMSKKVFVYDNNYPSILYKEFNSCSETAKFFDSSNSSISRYLDTKKLYLNRWLLFSIRLP